MTNITKLKPRLESLVSTITQPKMSLTVSISLLKSTVDNDGFSYAVSLRSCSLRQHFNLFSLLLQALICLVDKKTGEKSKTRPRFVKQDQVCIARLRTAGTICLETFKDFPQMGRFTLRDEGKSA